MDEIAKILVGSSPVLAALVIIGGQLIASVKDVVIAQETAADERADIKKRLERLEALLITNAHGSAAPNQN